MIRLAESLLWRPELVRPPIPKERDPFSNLMFYGKLSQFLVASPLPPTPSVLGGGGGGTGAGEGGGTGEKGGGVRAQPNWTQIGSNFESSFGSSSGIIF